MVQDLWRANIKKVTPFSFNFLYYAAGAFLFPFVVLYYQGLGFTGVQIGLLSGMVPLLALVGAPLWTGIADTTGRHRLVMSLTIMVPVIAVLIFPFLKTLGPVLLLMIVTFFFNAPVTSFADSATMNMLAGEKEMYGRVRLGGTIGWGLAAPLAGMLVQAYGLKWAFWGNAALMFVGLFVSQGFIHGKIERKTSVGGGLRSLLTDRRWILFLTLAFVAGMAFASTNNYLFPFMKELKANETTMGIALTISTLSELPVLFFANRLIRRFKADGLLLLGMLFTALRLLLFAASSSATAVLVIQLLQGLTFPAFWVAGVSYANENAPEGMSATAQGVFSAMIFGFGSAAGGFLGGVLLGSLGGRNMYLILGAIVLVSTALIALINRRPSAIKAA
ncbi:MAG: major facilitator superfamily domain-containing protein 6 [Anaerolineales bacterium]